MSLSVLWQSFRRGPSTWRALLPHFVASKRKNPGHSKQREDTTPKVSRVLRPSAECSADDKVTEEIAGILHYELWPLHHKEARTEMLLFAANRCSVPGLSRLRRDPSRRFLPGPRVSRPLVWLRLLAVTVAGWPPATSDP